MPWSTIHDEAGTARVSLSLAPSSLLCQYLVIFSKSLLSWDGDLCSLPGAARMEHRCGCCRVSPKQVQGALP